MTAPRQDLPLFYNDVVPLSSHSHGNWRARPMRQASFLAKANMVPLTVDEFGLAQRFYPVVFANNDELTPVGVFGLTEGVNVFTDADGGLLENIYLPAYVRRYPFVLGEREGSATASLCFDRSAGLLGEFADGEPLFVDGKPSEATLGILKFCEQVEAAGKRTVAFTQLLKGLGLLAPSDATFETKTGERFTFGNFLSVDREKLRKLDGAKLAELMQNNALPLLFAHLLSQNLFEEIYNRQAVQGRVAAGG